MSSSLHSRNEYFNKITNINNLQNDSSISLSFQTKPNRIKTRRTISCLAFDSPNDREIVFAALCVVVSLIEKPQEITNKKKTCVFLSKKKKLFFVLLPIKNFEKKKIKLFLFFLIAAFLSSVSRKNEEIISNVFITPRFHIFKKRKNFFFFIILIAHARVSFDILLLFCTKQIFNT